VPVDYRCFEIPDRFVVDSAWIPNSFTATWAYVAVMKHEKPA